MKCNQLINLIEKTYPLYLQESWDSSGLALLTAKSLKKILICLDVTKQITEYAIDNQFDIIISHHPLIFQSYFNNPSYIRQRYQQLRNHKIGLYSMHTNYDIHPYGMNYRFIERLGLANKISIQEMLCCFECQQDIIMLLKKHYSDNLRIYNNRKSYTKIACLLGAGGSMLSEVVKQEAQVFISSEFKHHEILYAQEKNIMLIDITHQIERIFTDDLQRFLMTLGDFEIEVKNDLYDVKGV